MSWGSHGWAVLQWGEGEADYPIQGDEPIAKQDTRFAAQGSPSTDRSQYGTDLTTSGSFAAYEVASARAALTGEWTLEHRAEYDYTAHNKNVILAHAADAGTGTYEIAVGATGVEFASGGILLHTMPLTSGVIDRSISWAMRANPDTTGASDAQLSEFTAYNHTAGAYELDHVQVAHAAPTSDVAHHLTVHGQWDQGLTTLNNEFGVAVKHVRVSAAWHSHVEVAEDWVNQRAWVAPAVDQHSEPLPVRQASGMGDEGEIIGATQLGYLCEHQRHALVRGCAVLMNEVYNQRPTWLSTYVPANFMRKVPGTDLRMPLTYLRWVPLPENASHIYARLQVLSYVTGGAAVPIKFAVVTMNFPPGMNLDWQAEEGPPQQFEAYWNHETITVDHTAGGTGQWLELGKIKVARSTRSKPGWSGTTFLAIAYEVDPEAASGNDAAARVVIGACHVWALSEVPGDGELTPDLQLPDLGE